MTGAEGKEAGGMTTRSVVEGDIPLEGITRGESNLTSCAPPMFLPGFSEKEQ